MEEQEIVILMHNLRIGEHDVYVQFRESVDPYEQVIIDNGKATHAYVFCIECVATDEHGNIADTPIQNKLRTYLESEGFIDFIEEELTMFVLDILDEYGTRDEIIKNKQWEQYVDAMGDAWHKTYSKAVTEI